MQHSQNRIWSDIACKTAKITLKDRNYLLPSDQLARKWRKIALFRVAPSDVEIDRQIITQDELVVNQLWKYQRNPSYITVASRYFIAEEIVKLIDSFYKASNFNLVPKKAVGTN